MGEFRPDFTPFGIMGSAPALAPRDIHCWLVPISGPVSEDTVLDADEHSRAARFHFAKDRNRFVAGRVWCREILGLYLGQAAGTLTFERQSGGKPIVTGEPISYNFSRSGDWGLIAISQPSIIGADIEKMRATDDLPYVARGHFSSAEQASLARLKGDHWFDGFFACWTRKEAVVKAIGEGILMPLDCFDVSLDPASPATIIDARADAAVAQGWSLIGFRPDDGYWGAIATNIPEPKLSFYTPA